jgi:hypothetical protein
LTPKQVGQLVHPLHQDVESRDEVSRYSYCELIEYLFGRQTLEDLLAREGISSFMGSHPVIRAGGGTSAPVLSDKLRANLEFNYGLLESAASTVTDGQNRLTRGELFEVLKKTRLRVVAKDRQAITAWYTKKVKDRRKVKDGLVSIYDLFEDFDLTKRLANLKTRITAHFSGNHERALAANKVMAPNHAHSYEELVDFLKKAGLPLKQLNVELEEKEVNRVRDI